MCKILREILILFIFYGLLSNAYIIKKFEQEKSVDLSDALKYLQEIDSQFSNAGRPRFGKRNEFHVIDEDVNEADKNKETWREPKLGFLRSGVVSRRNEDEYN